MKQVMHGLTMTQTRKGRKLWKLSSPKAKIQLDGEALLDSPEVLFFREGEKEHSTTARSKTASVEAESQDVHLVGNVVITAHAEETILKTDRLVYHNELEKFRTESEVLVTRPGMRLKGVGMEADAGLTDITIYKQRTVLHGEDG